MSSPCWSTASFGTIPDATPVDLSALGSHLDLCRQAGGHWFAMKCTVEDVHAFMASRFVTTVLLGALLIASVSQIF